MHTYTPWDRKSQQQRLNARRRLKQYERRSYVSIYICMSIYIYMHIHICARSGSAASVSQMCTLMSNKHLYNVYLCTCTSAQNLSSKVLTTLTAEKMHIYTYTHMHTHKYAHKHWHACASMTLHHTPTRPYWDWQSMHKYANTYIYTCIYMHTYTHTYTHAYIYIYTCLYTHIHTHIYTHTYDMYICTHTSTPAMTAWQRLREKPDLKPRSSTLLPVRTAHHTITTGRHPDYTCSSVLVRDQPIRSMAVPAAGHGRSCAEIGFTFLPFKFPPF